MPVPKQILVATDLTARGDRPFARAKMLADFWDAGRTLLFVNSPKNEVDIAKVESLLLRNYGKDAEGCNLAVNYGKPPEVIADTAAQLGSDLIIVGAARHNNISDFFLGTAVDNLVHHAAAPVLIVKERPRANYDRILVATDFSDFSAQALRTALDFFPGAEIDFVHAYHVAYEAWLKSDGVAAEMLTDAEKELQDFMAAMNLSVSDQARVNPHLVEGDLHQSVHHMLDTGDFDLLVLGTHGRSGFVMATIGSRASEMMGWSPVDVLMVRKSA
ncbi:MAG: universal stress protein [Sphingomonadales bacterium]|nr:universal stress protein [Sphingomonadales bacterium]NCP01658.1 universal stress protein [Sphingomonadales bacterium]NCP25342.1 universal stress protein [Sphingomonadales bacterium]NCP42970.1 universal stress protein [Sphingomonadales bacterium]NCP50596.1 universal stress protein [Sphingomonadales bacterium]